MKFLVVLSVLLASAYARETALRVKWGVANVSVDYFIEIPRAVADIEEDGWVETVRPSDSYLPTLTMYCTPDDVTFCALFDAVGVIAGLQIALATALFTEMPFEYTTIGFSTWNHTDGAEYWVTQQYFVSEETVAAGITEAATDTLREGAIWVIDFDGNLMKIGDTGEDMETSDLFTKQGCYPTMGVHYIAGVYPEGPCDSLFPWFTLITNDTLVGTGLGVYGKFAGPADGDRMWFERQTVLGMKAIAPNAQQCLYDLTGNPGLTTMHIFYNDRHPSTILC